MLSLVEKAKEIRKILKKEFPNIKFSVRKQHYCSVYVNYEGDIPTREVFSKICQFESIDRCHVTGEILAGGNDFIIVQNRKF